MQLELPHAGSARPRRGLGHECRSDALPAAARGDHQPEVGHVVARRMRVARDRQPADDALGGLCDEDGRVRVATEALQVAALVGGLRQLRSVISQPSARSPRRGRAAARASASAGVACRTSSQSGNDDAVPATARIAGRARLPSSRNSTAAAPPKYRFRRRQRISSYPIASSRSSPAGPPHPRNERGRRRHGHEQPRSPLRPACRAEPR